MCVISSEPSSHFIFCPKEYKESQVTQTWTEGPDWNRPQVTKTQAWMQSHAGHVWFDQCHSPMTTDLLTGDTGAAAQKVVVSCSQTIHRNKDKWVNVSLFQSEVQFITSIFDEPSTRHIISILTDQTLQFETVSVTLWSNQERWWRLPFIWVDNLLGRTRRST